MLDVTNLSTSFTGQRTRTGKAGLGDATEPEIFLLKTDTLGMLRDMTTNSGVTLSIGGADEALSERLNKELNAFNAAATGADDQQDLSVRFTDAAGELVGGLTGWTWGGTAGIEVLWVQAGRRREGWGRKLLQAAEGEALRRGCTRVVLSSFTFQAPDFYRRHGYVETGRAEGFPGGHADIHFLKQLTPTLSTAKSDRPTD